MLPNPWGKKGQPAHQRRILQIENRLSQQGWQTVSGGSLPEKKFGKRFPDIVMQKGQKIIAVQVGKTTKKGSPVIRERRAIFDLKATNLFNQSHLFFEVLNMTTNNVSSSQSIILNLDNWTRQGSGKIFQFTALDEQLLEILQSSLPTQFAPYSILATFMSKEGKIYKQSSFSVQLPDFLPKKHQGLWQFFIQSHVLSPDLPITEGFQLDRLFAFNGLINLQHGRLVKGVCQKSSIGIVEQLKNLNTGELLKRKESIKIFNALKKALQKGLKKEVAFECPKVSSRNRDYPEISASQITSVSR